MQNSVNPVSLSYSLIYSVARCMVLLLIYFTVLLILYLQVINRKHLCPVSGLQLCLQLFFFISNSFAHLHKIHYIGNLVLSGFYFLLIIMRKTMCELQSTLGKCFSWTKLCSIIKYSYMTYVWYSCVQFYVVLYKIIQNKKLKMQLENQYSRVISYCRFIWM